MEEFELADIGVPTERLSAALREAGMHRYHLPIVDAGVPDARFEEQWLAAGGELRELLLGGDSIVIHCKGGLGRTGMIQVRLLVELGAAASTAIRSVRGARDGAIETRAQEDHVRGITRPAAATGDR